MDMFIYLEGDCTKGKPPRRMAGKGVKKMYRTVRVLTFYMDLYNGRKKGHLFRQPSKIRHIKFMLQLLYVPGIALNFPA